MNIYGGYTSFTYLINNYNGSSDITNSLVKPWLSYLNSNYGANRTDEVMKAVAYMLDTNEWSTFTDNSGKAEYAIGGPTLDLFCASYNQKYPNNQIQYQIDSEGYKVKLSTDSSYGDNVYIEQDFLYESWYTANKTEQYNGMWLASPSNNAGEVMMIQNYGGLVTSSPYYYYNRYENRYGRFSPNYLPKIRSPISSASRWHIFNQVKLRHGQNLQSTTKKVD